LYNNLPLDNSAVLDGFSISKGAKPSGFGGGIYNVGASPTIKNCLFTNNSSNTGGAIYCQSGSPVFINCVVSGNTAAYGGGVALKASAASFTNCVISNNTATGQQTSGGIDIGGNTPGPILTNCTLYGNTANGSGSGGAIASYYSVSIVHNCIFWGNTGTIGANGINDIGGGSVVTHSLIQQPSGVFLGAGNINADPLFIDTTARNYRLQACSPAINKGENGSIPTGIATDLAAETRIKASAVDMGAYEFAGFNNGNPNGGDLLASNGDAASATISGSTMLTATASSCRVVANILPIGPAPVSGNVTAQVWVDATQPGNYVKRHYQVTPVTSDGITPSANAGTATGRVTLYFTQQEFDDFNFANTTQLPKNPTDGGKHPKREN
jgi:predicted outer membrane repeat protein